MKSIELLGASGVGKTYLYQKLFEVCNERKYLNVKEACIKAASGVPTSFGFNKQWVYKLLLSSNMVAKKKYGLSRKILLHQHLDCTSSANYLLSSALLNDFLATELNIEVVKKRKENFKRCVNLQAALKPILTDKVLFDEGALHHHHGLTPSILSSHTPKEIKKDVVLNPNAVVFLELPFEKHLSRIIERKEKGIKTFSHAKLSGVALEKYAKKNIAEYQEKIQTLKMLGVPVLHVNAEKEVTENLKHINAFINNLN
ncbi:hypothetical protein [Pedobacter sp. SL55]|uniref:hypothetical protein n=1 Tax=Pedobacter sp. SL55 TaxID=2995161 RepID=UPI00226FA9A1|nr:hypothetical protein [Pedobacter sp. SL55]WAC40191.1 hypothetical protein OVA16_16685 [Pedobacter sp. SL55]